MTWQMADIWENIAAAIPDKPAIVDGDKTVTYRELDERSTRVARNLLDLGCDKREFRHPRRQALQLGGI